MLPLMSKSAPEKARLCKSTRYLTFVILVALPVVALLLKLFPPQKYGFWPGCLLYKLTGLHCPFCGCTRSLHALLSGDFAASIAWNPLLLPMLAMLLSLCFFAAHRLYRRFAVVFLAIMLLFGILRNLPWTPFTILAPHGL